MAGFGDNFEEEDWDKLTMTKNQNKADLPERWFEHERDEVFETSDFDLIFIHADGVTNVTRLNRVMSRRCLLFMGNK